MSRNGQILFQDAFTVIRGKSVILMPYDQSAHIAVDASAPAQVASQEHESSRSARESRQVLAGTRPGCKRLDRVPRCAAQRGELGRVVEHAQGRLGQAFDVEERLDQAVLAGLDHLAHRRDVGGQHHAAGGHRVQQRPRKHERRRSGRCAGR